MKRREFIAGLGGAAAWPLVARGQDRQQPIVGCLVTSSEEGTADLFVPFREGLKEVGYEVGRNVAIEYRWADNHMDRLPSLAADLVHRDVTVLVTVGGGAPAFAAKAATSTIPIVFMSGEDPVKIELVEFNEPTRRQSYRCRIFHDRSRTKAIGSSA